MIKLLISLGLFIICIIQGSSVQATEVDCLDGDFRFRYNFSSSAYRSGDEFREDISGLLEICYNGTYHGVCTGNYNTQTVAEVVCSLLDYDAAGKINNAVHVQHFAELKVV